MKRWFLVFSATIVASGGMADIVLTRPARDERVVLVHSPERAMFKFETREARLEAIKKDKEGEGVWLNYPSWRKPATPTFEWIEDASCTNGVRVWFSTDPEFEPGRDTWFVPLASGKGCLYAHGLRGNFKVATRYYWKIAPFGAAESPVSTFVTADSMPRWIALNSEVANIRDVGGWKTIDGRRVRQGLLYRGQGLNWNSVNKHDLGENRLAVTDVDFFRNRLGVKTDLDLRSDPERPGLVVSPLGSSVELILNSSGCYGSMYSEEGKRSMALTFRTCADSSKQPVYIHCISGADRTGSVVFMLNGVLGVPEHDLLYDWECTFYPDLFKDDYYLRWPKLREPLEKYPGATLCEKIESYLHSCGITQQEIDDFRALMLADE